MSRFEHLLACYVSGQMIEADWEWHLETDELFCAWWIRKCATTADLSSPGFPYRALRTRL
jgi:hypothetical protein